MSNQLRLDLPRDPTDLSDLDMEHAERVLAAERLTGWRLASACECVDRPLPAPDDFDGQVRCAKCGKELPA